MESTQSKIKNNDESITKFLYQLNLYISYNKNPYIEEEKGFDCAITPVPKVILTRQYSTYGLSNDEYDPVEEHKKNVCHYMPKEIPEKYQHQVFELVRKLCENDSLRQYIESKYKWCKIVTK